MKFKNHVHIIGCIFVCILFAGCKNTTNPKEHDDFKASIIREDTVSHLKTEDFDAAEFLRGLEPLLSSISGQHLVLRCVIDTISNITMRDTTGVFTSLHPESAEIIRRFTFDPGKGYRQLSIGVISASYKDTTALNKAFTDLKKQSGPVTATDHTPGLTYTNDYVLKTRNRIYWLNSGCIYAYQNHQRIESLIRRVVNSPAQDSILCKCGDVKCR